MFSAGLLACLHTGYWPEEGATDVVSSKTKLRMACFWYQTLLYISSAPLWAYFDWHHFSVLANHNAGFRSYCSHCMLSGQSFIQDQRYPCWYLHHSTVNHNLGGLQHVQTPRLPTSVSKNRHKMVYSNTSIQGLKYSTVLMKNELYGLVNIKYQHRVLNQGVWAYFKLLGWYHLKKIHVLYQCNYVQWWIFDSPQWIVQDAMHFLLCKKFNIQLYAVQEIIILVLYIT